MATWKDNPAMEWLDPRDGSPTEGQWVKISDHNRAPLSISVERIENKTRMADGTLRRYVVAKKRTWSASWESIPSQKTPLLVNGESGSWMEAFHDEVDGSFQMRLRKGQDTNKSAGMEEVEVMITDFSKEVLKRGVSTDLWTLDVTLEEV